MKYAVSLIYKKINDTGFHIVNSLWFVPDAKNKKRAIEIAKKSTIENKPFLAEYELEITNILKIK